MCTNQYWDGAHEILLRKDIHGVVRAYFRKSSKATTWLPEGEGYPIFRTSVPPHDEAPPPARAKPDTAWNRLEIEGTIRSWYAYFTGDNQYLELVKAEWQRRFNELPQGGDTTLLPDRLKLPWEPLPKRAPRQVADDLEEYGGLSSCLENPPLNPISGPGRKPADVIKELDAYKHHMREGQCVPEGSPPAVFQADYLFGQMPGRGIALFRVCNGATLANCVDVDISFTAVEYEHTPHPEVDAGFWGTFEPLPNARYNSEDSRSGTKFVRHLNVTREFIVLYGVETFTERITVPDRPMPITVVRVTAATLHRLSVLRPEFTMPDEVCASCLLYTSDAADE